LHTNVNVPKRLRSGPIAKEPRNSLIVENLENDPRLEPTIIKKKITKKRGQWSKCDMKNTYY